MLTYTQFPNNYGCLLSKNRSLGKLKPAHRIYLFIFFKSGDFSLVEDLNLSEDQFFTWRKNSIFLHIKPKLTSCKAGCLIQYVNNQTIDTLRREQPSCFIQKQDTAAVRETVRGPVWGSSEKAPRSTCCRCQSPVGNTRSHYTLPYPCLAILLRQWALCRGQK